MHVHVIVRVKPFTWLFFFYSYPVHTSKIELQSVFDNLIPLRLIDHFQSANPNSKVSQNKIKQLWQLEWAENISTILRKVSIQNAHQ